MGEWYLSWESAWFASIKTWVWAPRIHTIKLTIVVFAWNPSTRRKRREDPRGSQPVQWALGQRESLAQNQNQKPRQMILEEQYLRLSSGPPHTHVHIHVHPQVNTHTHTHTYTEKYWVLKNFNQIIHLHLAFLSSRSPINYEIFLWNKDLHRAVNKWQGSHSSISHQNNLITPQTDTNYHRKWTLMDKALFLDE